MANEQPLRHGFSKKGGEKVTLKQAITACFTARKWALCQLCVLSFRVEVKESHKGCALQMVFRSKVRS